MTFYYLKSSRSVGESSVTVNVFQRFDCAIGRFDGGGEDEGLLLVDRPVDRHLGRFPVIILIINIIDLVRNFKHVIFNYSNLIILVIIIFFSCSR